MDIRDYPALGFRFKVTSTASPQGDGVFSMSNNSIIGIEESYFQSISGIKATAGESIVINGGRNNRQYKLPAATTYPDLVLSRGLIKKDSSLGRWCRNFLIADNNLYSVERRIFNVMLIGKDKDDILMTWSFYDCYPKELEVGAFNADKSEIAIETLTLAYSYFKQEYHNLF